MPNLKDEAIALLVEMERIKYAPKPPPDMRLALRCGAGRHVHLRMAVTEGMRAKVEGGIWFPWCLYLCWPPHTGR